MINESLKKIKNSFLIKIFRIKIKIICNAGNPQKVQKFFIGLHVFVFFICVLTGDKQCFCTFYNEEIDPLDRNAFVDQPIDLRVEGENFIDQMRGNRNEHSVERAINVLQEIREWATNMSQQLDLTRPRATQNAHFLYELNGLQKHYVAGVRYTQWENADINDIIRLEDISRELNTLLRTMGAPRTEDLQ